MPPLPHDAQVPPSDGLAASGGGATRAGLDAAGQEDGTGRPPRDAADDGAAKEASQPA